MTQSHPIASQPFQVPKLKIQAELVQEFPGLKKYFPRSNEESRQEFGGQSGTAGKKRPQIVNEDWRFESEELNQQLKNAKREQGRLQAALSTAREANHHRIGELDLRFVSSLRESLSQKSKLLNELRLHRAELEERLEILEMEYRDCMLSAPDEDGSKTAETTRIEALLEKLASLQTRKKEISTTINQYRLLKERSLQDRDEAEMKMHQSKGTAEAAEDDLRIITAFFYDSQVEQDKAERLLGEAISQLDISRTEWQKRTREVRKRVEALQRAKLREEKEETERKEIEIKKKEVAALERNAAIEQQAALEAEMNNPEVLAQLEKAEALWARLQGASGCRQPQDIILAYNDLHQRSNALQNLLFLAKKKEQNFQDSLLAVSHYGTQQTEQKTVDHPCQAVNDSNDAEQRIGAQMQRLEKVCAIAELSLASLRNRLVNIHQSTTRDPLTKNREGEKSVSDTTSIAESCNSLMDEIEALLQEISEYKNMNDEGGALLGSGITNGSSLASMQPPMHRRGTFIGSPWWPASGVTMNNGATTDSSKPDKVEQGGSGGDDDGVLERNFSDLEVGLKVKKDEAEYNEAEDEGEGDEDDEVAGHMTVLSIQDRAALKRRSRKIVATQQNGGG